MRWHLLASLGFIACAFAAKRCPTEPGMNPRGIPVLSYERVCDSSKQEEFQGKCYDQCRILTNGEFPIRTGINQCSYIGCHKNEEVFQEECYATCAGLTKGEYPFRVAGNVCVTRKDCDWHADSSCVRIDGIGCTGFRVDSNNSCPRDTHEYSDKIQYSNTHDKVNLCNPYEVEVDQMCYPAC